MTQANTSQIRDQGLRDGPREGVAISTKRRAIPWKMDPPVFVSGNSSANLCQYSLRGKRVFIVGNTAKGSEVLAASADAKKVYTDGHYPLVVAANGAQVTYAAQWFGDGPYTTDDAHACWVWLEAALQGQWRDEGIRLLMTPATTGRDLFARSIGFDHPGWPVMDPDVQTIIRASAGQGRMETMPQPGWHGGITRLYEYDARMAYVALLDQLPVGDPDWLDARRAAGHFDLNPYGEGRYRLAWFEAPQGWRHPGLLPCQVNESARLWEWPLSSGDAETWCSGVELFTAQRAGWRFGFRDAYVWHHYGAPLGAWRDRLLRIIDLSRNMPQVREKMIRAAVRGIVLHAIGSFHGAPHVTTEYGADPPAEARYVRPAGVRGWAWQIARPPVWPEMIHPEWSSTIWGRARARLASSHRGRNGFLTVPPDILVAFRTDAIYTTSPTGWEHSDNGQPGHYRLKEYEYETPQPWPKAGSDVLRLAGKR